jgi:peptidoglycan hydrolase-like protein with peptidoglycan-binding domain
MQKALNAKAGTDLNGDGEFGEETLVALKVFQQKAGLLVTGRGDVATRAALGLILASDASGVVAPADPMQPATPVEGIHVTGGTVNIRVGPGTGFDIVKDVKKGTVLTPVDADGWRPVLIGDDVCWISEKYSEMVG